MPLNEATEKPILVEEMVNLQRVLEGTLADVSESGVWAARLYMQRVPEERLGLLAEWAEAFATTVKMTVQARALELARDRDRSSRMEAIRQEHERFLHGLNPRTVEVEDRPRRLTASPSINLESLLED